MNWLVVTFVVSAVASVTLTVMVRAIARHCGVVDLPDGKRKLHGRPIALWGGVAVYLALGIGLMVAGHGSFGSGREFSELSTVLIISAGIVCFFGAVDDCWCLGSRLKLLLQVGAVLPIIALGYWIEKITVFGVPINLGWAGIPLTILWLVGCINSLNLLDGMDGPASTVGLITAVMLALVATTLGHDHVSVIALVLAGTLAGFLVHNLPPASIFLGDSGSMVIGLVLGVLGMQGALKTSTTLAITLPAVIMSLPIFDTALALVRRKLTGRRFDAADREHIHHRLLDRGLSPWQALCLLSAVVLTTGAAATAACVFRNDSLAWITALALIVLLIRLRLVGHYEVALVKTAVAQTLVRWARRLHAPVAGPAPVAPADLAELDLDAAWNRLIEQAKACEAHRIEVVLFCKRAFLHRYGWSADPLPATATAVWSLTMIVGQHDGRTCELRLWGPERTLANPAQPTMRTEVLHAFAEHFSSHIGATEPPVIAGKLGSVAPTPPSPVPQSRAA